MEHTDEKINIKNVVLEKIRSSELRMHPKYYFYLRVAGLAIVSMLILLVSIFILNFILFSIRINSEDILFQFGPRGWSAFFAFFPWHLLALDAFLLVVLLGLMRQFRFGYKNPLVYSLLAIGALILVAGFAVDRTTGINEHFLRRAQVHGLPGPFNDLYIGIHRMSDPRDGVCRCRILFINGNIIKASDIRSPSTTFSIMLPMDDSRATSSGLEVGDTIFIAGERVPAGIQAFGLRKVIFSNEIKPEAEEY